MFFLQGFSNPDRRPRVIKIADHFNGLSGDDEEIKVTLSHIDVYYRALLVFVKFYLHILEDGLRSINVTQIKNVIPASEPESSSFLF